MSLSRPTTSHVKTGDHAKVTVSGEGEILAMDSLHGEKTITLKNKHRDGQVTQFTLTPGAVVEKVNPPEKFDRLCVYVDADGDVFQYNSWTKKWREPGYSGERGFDYPTRPLRKIHPLP